MQAPEPPVTGEASRRIAIITRTLVPGACGIGDYTFELERALSALGHRVLLLGGRVSDDTRVRDIGDEWDGASLERANAVFEEVKPDQIVLQYTPEMYADAAGDNAQMIEASWAAWGRRWSTVLTVHETYSRVWWYPPSWARGTAQRNAMRRLASRSRVVLCASEPLIAEMAGWNGRPNVRYLPIGSNFDVVPCARDRWRFECGIGQTDFVVVLFGGGNSLRWLAGHVEAVDSALRRAGVVARWVLLGGIPREWFSLRMPVHVPGRLASAEISAWLQASDLFLMPHHAGVCGKRGTLMAAMQHGLPVVGTRGPMSDAFWDSVPGVVLVPRSKRSDLAAAVVELAKDQERRERIGAANRAFFSERFTWKRIAREFVALTAGDVSLERI